MGHHHHHRRGNYAYEVVRQVRYNDRRQARSAAIGSISLRLTSTTQADAAEEAAEAAEAAEEAAEDAEEAAYDLLHPVGWPSLGAIPVLAAGEGAGPQYAPARPPKRLNAEQRQTCEQWREGAMDRWREERAEEARQRALASMPVPASLRRRS